MELCGSERFRDFLDMFFRAFLDLLEFVAFAEFSKVSINYLEEFVDVMQKAREFFTGLSYVHS